MKLSRRISFLSLVALLLVATALHADPGTAFSYQGRLEQSSVPVDGTVSLRFTLFDAVTGGATIGTPVTVTDLTIADGLFTASLDFGAAAMDGQPRWLEIEVDGDGGTDSFVALSPRQPIQPAPYAIYSENANIAQTVVIDNVDDADSDPTNEIQDLNDVLAAGTDAGGLSMTNLGSVTAASFAGDGSGLTGITDNVDDADADPSNELTTGFSLQGTSLMLTDAGGTRSVALDSIVAPSELTVGEAIGESGSVMVTQTDRATSHTVTLNRSYSNPVIILGMIGESDPDPASANVDPTTLRVIANSANSFTFQINEWNYLDGARPGPERVSYLVIEAGRYDLPGGAVLQAGTVRGSGGGEFLFFDGDYDVPPTLLLQVMSLDDPNPVASRVDSRFSSDALVYVQREEAGGNGHPTETIGYLALTPGASGSLGGLRFESGETTTTTTPTTGSFEFAFDSTPGLFTTVQSLNGADPVTVRTNDLTTSGFSYLLQEEQSDDAEVTHTDETVGFLAIEEGDIVTSSALSLVLADGTLVDMRDNLGNHQATQALAMNGNDIDGASDISASSFAGDGSALSGITLDARDGSPTDVVRTDDAGNVIMVAPFKDQFVEVANSQINNTTSVSQSFTAGVTGELVRAGFSHGSATTVSSVTVSIFEGEGSGGTELFTEVLDITPGVETWVEFEVDTLPIVTAGQVYTLQLQSPGSLLEVLMDQSNPYPGGEVLAGPGFAWDILFRTYVSTSRGLSVGIGTEEPATELEVAGTITATALNVAQSVSATSFVGDGSALTNLPPVSQLDAPGGVPSGVLTAGSTGNISIGVVGEEIDQENNSSNAIDTVQVKRQSFTAGLEGRLSGIEVWPGSGTAEEILATLSVFEGEGTGGALLSTTSVSFQANANDWVQLPVEEPLLNEGQLYTFRLRRDNGSVLTLRVSQNSRYPDGKLLSSPSPNQDDLRFRTRMILGGQLNVEGGVTAGAFVGDGSQLSGLTLEQVVSNSGDAAGNDITNVSNLGVMGAATVDTSLTVNGTTTMDGPVGIGEDTPDTIFHVTDSITDGFVATIENTANSADLSNGLRIIAGADAQIETHRMISFVRPDGTEIGAVRQVANNTVDFFAPSDGRLKDHFRAASRGLADLLRIDVLDYEYKDEPGRTQTGFVAQQLAEVYPDAVSKGGEDESSDPWMVSYSRLVPLLVQAIQDQQAEIEKQRTELNALRAEKDATINDLQSRLERLERLLELQSSAEDNR